MSDLRYKLTNNWFEKNIQSWSKLLLPLQNIIINVLEIGVYEGASTIWILENLLLKPASKIFCIDNFEGGIEHQTEKQYSAHLPYLEERFQNNILKTGKSNQVTLIKSLSKIALCKLNLDNKKFDLIYIDASHLASDVISDAVLSWNLLKTDGILIFDDYKWEKYKENFNNPKLAIDAFIDCYKPELEIIHCSYQIIVQKKVREKIYTLNESKASNL